jgi:GxxExxY protein
MESRQLNDISFLIIQAAIEVHRTLGPGLLESVYRTCMIYELRQRNLDVIAERLVPICYKEVIFEGGYRLDLQVADQIIVEIKAVENLLPVHLCRAGSVVSPAHQKTHRASHQFQRAGAYQRCEAHHERLRAGRATLKATNRTGPRTRKDLNFSVLLRAPVPPC